MVKKRKEKNSRGVAAMEDDTPAVPEREAVPESKAGGEGERFMRNFQSPLVSFGCSNPGADCSSPCGWNVMMGVG
jgi:hypothetical protein